MKQTLILARSWAMILFPSYCLKAQINRDLNLTADLLRYYSFSGDAIDQSGNQNNEIISGPFLFARNKPSGYSYESYITFELDRIARPSLAKLRLF